MYKYFILIALAFSACKDTYKADYEVKAELELIDTLGQRLQTVKDQLDYMSLDEVKERLDIIEHNLSFCDAKIKEKNVVINEENAAMLSEYASFTAIYKNAEMNYKPVVTSLEELIVQLKTLKESAHSKDYEKETFLKYFNSLKPEILSLYETSSRVIRPLKETDLAFERSEGKIEELAESLKTAE